MCCEQLIKDRDNVRPCRNKAAWVLRVKETREIIEHFCGLHTQYIMLGDNIDYYIVEKL